MASIDNLLADISHCALLEKCKSGGGGPCSTIVAVQDDVPLAAHQVPEPWTGRLDLARIVFVGSNPSIDPLEDYPGWDDDPDAIRRYFVERFDGGPGQIKDGRYSPSRDGGWGGAVRFWSSVRQRAFELLPDAVPGLDYALTEVVHCKSRGEIGVAEARSTCAERFFPSIVEQATSAGVFVVFGVHAARALAELFGTVLDSGHRLAQIEVAGRFRFVVYLDHPAGGGAIKRLRTALSEEEFDMVRRAVEGRWMVADDFQLRLADSAELFRFLTSEDPAVVPRDMPMRVAEYFDVVRSLSRHVGRTFASEQEADEALFAELNGGGFGINAGLREIVLEAVLEPR